MVAGPVVQCKCLPGNPDKLEQHVVGHCPAVDSDDVVAQGGTATGRRFSSLYLTAVISPSTTINLDFTPLAIPPQTMRTVNALVNSIQRRFRAATAARGGHTRY